MIVKDVNSKDLELDSVPGAPISVWKRSSRKVDVNADAQGMIDDFNSMFAIGTNINAEESTVSNNATVSTKELDLF